MPVRRRGRLSGGAAGILAALLVVYLGYPVLSFLVRIATGHDRGFDNAELWRSFWVSIQGATIATVIGVVCGLPLSWWLARHQGRLRNLLGVVVGLPLALPPLMGGVLLVFVVGPYSFLGSHSGDRLTETLGGVIIAQTFVSAPFLVVAARAAFASSDPAVGEAARTLGMGRVRRFVTVEVPAAGAGIRAGVALCWLRGFGEYGANVIIAYHPFSLPIYVANQVSGYPLSTTEAPTLLALVVAALTLSVAWLRPRRASRVELPAATEPGHFGVNPFSFSVQVSVDGFSLEVRQEEAAHRLAILGPSGSGKSLTLRSLLGLEKGATTLEVGGTQVGSLPVEARGLGWVPQGYGLLRTRSVWGQVRQAPSSDPGEAAWWMGRTGIEQLAARPAESLSGGQRQRVAVCRAMTARPGLLLLDEPFSALDTPVRHQLRRETRRLQSELGLSTIVVTHDPVEAATLSDQLIVLEAGRVLQQGPTDQVFARPVSLRVAALLGLTNVAEGELKGGHLLSGGIDLGPAEAEVRSGPVLWRVPPWALRLADSGDVPPRAPDQSAPPGAEPSNAGRLVVVGRVLDLTPTADGYEARVGWGQGADELVVPVDAAHRGTEGAETQVLIDRGALRLWARA